MSETILVADDHPLFRQALVMAAGQVRPQARAVECGSLDSALAAAQAHDDLALILLDLKMPGAEGYSGVAQLHAERPQVPILVVSAADPARAAREARRFGAIGFLSKDSDLDTIETVIGQALTGSLPESGDATDNGAVDDMAARVASLTPTQLKVLLCVLAGLLNKQIAHELGISEATVKAHMTAILRKMDVTNRTQAALAARALGLAVG
jgi:DNA-binding NarL/FixJ family response regulator